MFTMSQKTRKPSNKARDIKIFTIFKEKTTMDQIEDKIQADCVKWFRNNFLKYRRQLFAVPNGGLRDKRTAQKLKQTGTVPGIPDLIFVNNKKTVFLELKTKTGSTSTNQKLIHSTYKNEGFPVYIVRSIEQFQMIMCFELINCKKSNLNLFRNVAFLSGFLEDLTFAQFETMNRLFCYVVNMKINQSTDFEKLVCPTVVPFVRQCLEKFVSLEMDVANNFRILTSPNGKSFRKIKMF